MNGPAVVDREALRVAELEKSLRATLDYIYMLQPKVDYKIIEPMRSSEELLK